MNDFCPESWSRPPAAEFPGSVPFGRFRRVTERRRGQYVLTEDRDRVDLDRVHRWLSDESYWAAGRERDVVARSIDGSLPFSVLLGEEQVGFARVVTDGATFAWICDVFVDPAHRGHGLGTWLVDSIVASLTDRGILRLLLATRDAHEVYRRSGFEPLAGAQRFMELDRRPTRNAILGFLAADPAGPVAGSPADEPPAGSQAGEPSAGSQAGSSAGNGQGEGQDGVGTGTA